MQTAESSMRQGELAPGRWALSRARCGSAGNGARRRSGRRRRAPAGVRGSCRIRAWCRRRARAAVGTRAGVGSGTLGSGRGRGRGRIAGRGGRPSQDPARSRGRLKLAAGSVRVARRGARREARAAGGSRRGTAARANGGGSGGTRGRAVVQSAAPVSSPSPSPSSPLVVRAGPRALSLPVPASLPGARRQSTVRRLPRRRGRRWHRARAHASPVAVELLLRRRTCGSPPPRLRRSRLPGAPPCPRAGRLQPATSPPITACPSPDVTWLRCGRSLRRGVARCLALGLHVDPSRVSVVLLEDELRAGEERACAAIFERRLLARTARSRGGMRCCFTSSLLIGT